MNGHATANAQTFHEVVFAMSSIAINAASFERKPYAAWRHLLYHAFGIFQGGADVRIIRPAEIQAEIVKMTTVYGR